MQKQNPLLRVWELGKSQHSGLICAVISAFLGVLGGDASILCCGADDCESA